MTEQQIIEALATRVMGWELAPLRGGTWVEKETKSVAVDYNWNPLETIEDAWQLVDKIGPFEYRKSPSDIGGYQHIAEFFCGEVWWTATGKTAQEAICKAALQVFAADLTLR